MQSLRQQFETWVRNRPADEEYNYWDTLNCACGQFAETLGASHDSDLRLKIEGRFSRFAAEHPWTFGALADRLEAALKVPE